MTIEIGVLIGLASTMLGMTLGYLNYRRVSNREIQTDAVGNGELRADISYIKRGVEDIKLDLKVQEKQIRDITERVTRVEESTKSAHRRIDGKEK